MVTVQIASIPSRIIHLELTVNSLINQCDHMFIALNNYEEVPEYLKGNDKIEYKLMDNTLGDAAKFYGASERSGYILTCDDDLRYCEGYADLMVKGIDTHGGIVSILGKVYNERPIKSFSHGYTSLHSCLNNVKRDMPVDVVGTGVMGYHSDTIKIDPYLFPRRNMADIWVSKLAHELGIPLTVLAHHKYTVKYRMHSWRIWAKDRHDKYATEVVNSFLKLPE